MRPRSCQCLSSPYAPVIITTFVVSVVVCLTTVAVQWRRGAGDADDDGSARRTSVELLRHIVASTTDGYSQRTGVKLILFVFDYHVRYSILSDK